MKRLSILAIPLTLAGCSHVGVAFEHAFGGEGTKGNGKPQEVSRTVGEYDKVEVGSSFEVEASEGKLGPVKVSADSNLLPQIKTEVKNRTLKVWIEGSVSTSSPLKLTLSSPKLISFLASGAASVTLKLDSGADMNPTSSQAFVNSKRHDLRLVASGSSTIDVTGTPKNLDCDLSGASKVSIPTKITATSLKEFGSLKATLSGSSELSFDGWLQSLEADLSGASELKGKMMGHVAKVKLSGASTVSVGNFEQVNKDLSGASNATFGN